MDSGTRSARDMDRNYARVPVTLDWTMHPGCAWRGCDSGTDPHAAAFMSLWEPDGSCSSYMA